MSCSIISVDLNLFFLFFKEAPVKRAHMHSAKYRVFKYKLN